MENTRSAPPRVFTPEWTAQQERRYRQVRVRARPALYRLCTSADCQVLRDHIEALVEALPPESLRRVISRLRDPKLFAQTWNELAVGDSFRQMGHQVEFEPQWQGLTPDWSVRPAAGNGFLVEVLSSKAPEARKQCDAAWKAFSHLVPGLPFDVDLAISPPVDYDRFAYFNPPAIARQKEIVRELRAWLETTPAVKASIVIDAIEFTLVERRGGTGPAYCSVGTSPFKVDGEPLKRAVQDKASKYKEMVSSLRLPFLVSVVADFSSGRDFEDLESAVLGEIRCRLYRRADGPWQQVHSRAENGLFALYPTLSGVTWAEWNRGQIVHKLLRNPLAAYALTEGFLVCAPAG
jgi:hypothetical protein